LTDYSMANSFLAEKARNNNLVVLCPFFELGAGEFQWVSTIMFWLNSPDTTIWEFCVLFGFGCIRISVGVHKFGTNLTQRTVWKAFVGIKS